MRSTNDQLHEIIRRSDAIRAKERCRRRMLIDMITAALCLAFLVLAIYKNPAILK